ncbi:hypothetical protein NARC_80064 [Candidatus Nitrosocosmicus arcticus]|uniref:Uncharacterized protein n=1 Tax=Candidatus Nitrosocosmicus arcticus TaxID=2035267 RepID=A0A557SUR0_9ARCH|nr:hypothetical protein NARC_80064 [Candidatus Nitrosocosmicus arcticus]
MIKIVVLFGLSDHFNFMVEKLIKKLYIFSLYVFKMMVFEWLNPYRVNTLANNFA